MLSLLRALPLCGALSLAWGGQLPPVASAPDSTEGESVIELPESRSAGHSPAVSDAGVYRLDGAALRRFATLEEALDALPGFRVRRQGGLGGYSALSFRGARAGQIDIYVDGIRLNQDGDASPDLAKWPLLWFSSLEARTGMDPEGGSPGALARIDLSTRDESRANFQARAGSFSTLEAAASAQSPVTHGWALTVGIEGQTARNDYPFFSDNGTVYNTADDGTWRMDNNAYWSRGARATLRREGASRRQSISGVWLDSRKEYPGLFPSSAQAYGRRSDWLGAWRLEHFDGLLPWEAGVQARRFEDSYRDPGQSLGYLSYESARLSTSGEGDAAVRVPGALLNAPRLDLRADARLRAEETKPLVTPYSSVSSSPDATRGEAQAGIHGNVRFVAPWIATAEARQSFVRFRADGVRALPDTSSGPSGSSSRNLASADYHPFALRASLETARTLASLRHTFTLTGRVEQRAPTSGELLGDNLGILYKLDLRPEETRSVSLTHSLSALVVSPFASSSFSLGAGLQPSLQSTVFWNGYRDPIRLKAHGASSFMRFENDANYRSVGFETLASLAALPAFAGMTAEASVSLTLQEVSIDEGLYEGNQPAYQSPLESHAEFFVKPSVASVTSNTSVRLGMLADFRSPYYPGDANIPGSRRASEWEFGAHADLNRGALRLAADARNLTDRRYRDFAYSPRSGRSYSLSLSLTL